MMHNHVSNAIVLCSLILICNASPIDWSFLVETTTTTTPTPGLLHPEIEDCDVARRQSCQDECSSFMRDIEGDEVDTNETMPECSALFRCTNCIYEDHGEYECREVQAEYQLLVSKARDAFAQIICRPISEASTTASTTSLHSMESAMMRIAESERDIRCLESRKEYCMPRCYSTSRCQRLYSCAECMMQDHGEPTCQDSQVDVSNVKDHVQYNLIIFSMQVCTESERNEYRDRASTTSPTDMPTEVSTESPTTTPDFLETTTTTNSATERDVRCYDSRNEYCTPRCYRESKCDRLYACAECMMQDHGESYCQGSQVDISVVNNQVLYNLNIFSRSVCTDFERNVHNTRRRISSTPSQSTS